MARSADNPPPPVQPSDTVAAMTAAEKRTATRRANKAVREARAAEREATPLPAELEKPFRYEPCTAEDEASLLQFLQIVSQQLARCRANMAAAALRRREDLARQPVVSLADWRSSPVRMASQPDPAA